MLETAGKIGEVQRWTGAEWVTIDLLDERNDRVRQEALSQAVRSTIGANSDADLVKRAEAFHAFLSGPESRDGVGDTANEDAAEPVTVMNSEPMWYPPTPGFERGVREPILDWIDRVRMWSGTSRIGLRTSELTQFFAELVVHPRPLTLQAAEELPGLFYVTFP